MSEINSIADIQSLVVSGFDDWQSLGHVSVKGQRDLMLFKYNQTAIFENRWNFFECVSNGLIIDRTGVVIARGFDKMWNYGQRGRYPPYTAHLQTVMEKMDGSLGEIYRENNEIKIATRGSFNSEQAVWATEKLMYDHEHLGLNRLPSELTLLFEIIYPVNRIVVDYEGRESLTLLAARNRFTGDYLPFYPDLYELADTFGFDLVRTYNLTQMEIVERLGIIDVNLEGWVCEYSDGSRWKFKGDAYLELHKAISGLSYKNAVISCRNKTTQKVREIVPDEFLDEYDGWVASIHEQVAATEHDIYRTYQVSKDIDHESRKDLALWLYEYHEPIASYIFALYDGRDTGAIRDMIYAREFH